MSTASAPLQPTSALHNPLSAIPSHLRPAGPSRKTMSVTQTYYLAHKARGKLSREAAQPDHDLRLLVGHANLLDSLMFELAEAEREQERWFNQSVRGASSSKPAADKRHIQWADRVVEEAIVEEEEYDSDSSSDSDDSEFDYYDEDETATATAVSVAAPASPMMVQHDDFEEEYDDEEDYAQLSLARTPSHSGSPPELTIDHDSDSSDDESMPPSPADSTLHLPEKESNKDQQVFAEEEYYASRPNPTGLVSAILVY